MPRNWGRGAASLNSRVADLPSASHILNCHFKNRHDGDLFVLFDLIRIRKLQSSGKSVSRRRTTSTWAWTYLAAEDPTPAKHHRHSPWNASLPHALQVPSSILSRDWPIGPWWGLWGRWSRCGFLWFRIMVRTNDLLSYNNPFYSAWLHGFVAIMAS